MSTAIEKKPTLEQLAPGEVLCQYCEAKCCRYFALPIDTPESLEDFEFMRWFLLHQRASIFTEDEDWYMLVQTECKYLGDDQRCTDYENRPQICRDYTTKNCEYDDEWTYERLFETSEQVAEYAEAVLPRGRGEGIRSPRPSASGEPVR